MFCVFTSHLASLNASPAICVLAEEPGIFSVPELRGKVGIFPSAKAQTKVRNFSKSQSLYRGDSQRGFHLQGYFLSPLTRKQKPTSFVAENVMLCNWPNGLPATRPPSGTQICFPGPKTSRFRHGSQLHRNGPRLLPSDTNIKRSLYERTSNEYFVRNRSCPYYRRKCSQKLDTDNILHKKTKISRTFSNHSHCIGI